MSSRQDWIPDWRRFPSRDLVERQVAGFDIYTIRQWRGCPNGRVGTALQNATDWAIILSQRSRQQQKLALRLYDVTWQGKSRGASRNGNS